MKESVSKLNSEIGGVVSGDSFWNRKEEVAFLCNCLLAGESIMLIAQRRVGKTSLMHQVAEELSAKRVCLVADVQNCMRPEDVIAKIRLAANQQCGLGKSLKFALSTAFERFAQVVDSVKVKQFVFNVRDVIGMDWAKNGTAILDSLAELDKPAIIFLDELPMFISELLGGNVSKFADENIAAAKEFLSWLRYATIHYKSKIAFVVAGSIGLEPLVRRARLSATLNTFRPFKLHPWDRETARNCLLALANSYDLFFAEDALNLMLDKLGCMIPHHIQLFFGYVHRHCSSRKLKEITVERIEAVYLGDMLSSKGHVELFHMEQRLKKTLGNEYYLIAIDLLTEASVVGHLQDSAIRILCGEKLYSSPEGKRAICEVLDILDHDGYLECDAGRYSFRSGLLRDWWHARFSQFFIPAAQRGKCA